MLSMEFRKRLHTSPAILFQLMVLFVLLPAHWHSYQWSSSAQCPYGCSCQNDDVDCRDRGLTEIPPDIPETVTELRLEQNRITELPGRVFSAFKHLRRLDLSNNQISKVAGDAFYGLKSLTTLVLYGNRLTDLPRNVFHGLSSLQLLLLNANNISCIRKDLFSGLHNLSLLSLYDNKIQSLANGTFDYFKNIGTLHLGGNPFVCDCNLKWLSNYLQKNPIETSDARCAEPKRLSRKRIMSLDPVKFKCRGNEAYRTRNTCGKSKGIPEIMEYQNVERSGLNHRVDNSLVPEMKKHHADIIEKFLKELSSQGGKVTDLSDKLDRLLKYMDTINSKLDEIGKKNALVKLSSSSSSSPPCLYPVNKKKDSSSLTSSLLLPGSVTPISVSSISSSSSSLSSLSSALSPSSSSSSSSSLSSSSSSSSLSSSLLSLSSSSASESTVDAAKDEDQSSGMFDKSSLTKYDDYDDKE